MTVTRWDAVTVVSARGSLDGDGAARLRDVLKHFVRIRRGLIVDLSAVGTCHVAGERLLLALARSFQATGCHWVLIPGTVVSRRLRRAHNVSIAVAADYLDAVALLDDTTKWRTRPRGAVADETRPGAATKSWSGGPDDQAAATGSRSASSPRAE